MNQIEIIKSNNNNFEAEDYDDNSIEEEDEDNNNRNEDIEMINHDQSYKAYDFKNSIDSIFSTQKIIKNKQQIPENDPRRFEDAD